MSVLGVDVSSYQSVTFDTSGLSFAFVKATEGAGYVNPHYAGQLAHARAKGLVVGHYHFGHHGDAAAEVAHFKAHADVRPGEIIAYDWEQSGVTQADRDAFMKGVKAAFPHARVILYCNTDWWKNHDTESFVLDGLWIADPNHPIGHPGITHPWIFHQYSFAGGIDHNVANFGSVAALKAWASALVPKPAPVAPPKPVPAPVKPVQPPVVHPTEDQRISSLEVEMKAVEAKLKLGGM